MPQSFEDYEAGAQRTQAIEYISNIHLECCSGWIEESNSFGIDQDRKAPYFWYHSEDFNSEYPDYGPVSDPSAPQVCVEAGIDFYEDGAAAYFIRDYDSDVSSEEYGPLRVYQWEGDGSWDAWYELLRQDLREGAEVAFNKDLRTCSECGYHYNVMDPCHEEAFLDYEEPEGIRDEVRRITE